MEPDDELLWQYRVIEVWSNSSDYIWWLPMFVCNSRRQVRWSSRPFYLKYDTSHLGERPNWAGYHITSINSGVRQKDWGEMLGEDCYSLHPSSSFFIWEEPGQTWQVGKGSDSISTHQCRGLELWKISSSINLLWVLEKLSQDNIQEIWRVGPDTIQWTKCF